MPGRWAPFTYGFTAEGALVPMDDERLLHWPEPAACSRCCTCRRSQPPGPSPPPQAAALLRDPALQQTLAANVLQTMLEKGL